MEKPKVFLSVGSASTKLQRDATESIFAVIEATGLSPRQMEKNEWSSEAPLRGIRQVMQECHGAVIIAFTRYEFPAGAERSKDGSSKELGPTRFPTVWNQIEAALAYGRDVPLLVICENGLRDDGLLESKYDWRVFWTDFQPEELRSERFSGFLQSWKRLVEKHVETSRAAPAPVEPPPARVQPAPASTEPDLSKASLGKLLSYVTVPQLWAMLAALATVLAAVASAAFKLGGGKWPWQ
jgi:hypothetical protein